MESRGDPALRVFRASTSQLLVGPIRIVLGAALLAPAAVLGESAAPAGIAFAVGAFGLAFAALGDPRRRFLSVGGDPAPLPNAAVESPGEVVRHAVFPSTVGVAVLSGIAHAAREEMLAALLAGALAGMGAAAILSGLVALLRERETGRDLYVDRRARRLYFRPR